MNTIATQPDGKTLERELLVAMDYLYLFTENDKLNHSHEDERSLSKKLQEEGYDPSFIRWQIIDRCQEHGIAHLKEKTGKLIFCKAIDSFQYNYALAFIENRQLDFFAYQEKEILSAIDGIKIYGEENRYLINFFNNLDSIERNRLQEFTTNSTPGKYIFLRENSLFLLRRS